MTDDKLSSITPTDLYAVLGRAAAPVVIDVRRDPRVKAGEHMLAGAVWRSPGDVDLWLSDLPKGRGIVVYCADGGDVSRGVVMSLHKNGVLATYLAGGLKGWTDAKLPLRRARGAAQRASQWVTREHPKIDRLATIVRGADTSRPDLTPQCEGLLAISYRQSSNFPDDHEMLKHGLVIYDALYKWCRLQNEKH